MNWLQKLLQAGVNSVKNQVKTSELLKALVTGFGATNITALAIMLLSAVNDHVGAIFTNPLAAYFAGWLLSTALDALRRSVAGVDPIPVAPGQPVPTFGTFVPVTPVGDESSHPAHAMPL